MVLATIVFISWIVIVLFAIIPKRLPLVDMIFLYFTIVIVTTSTFTLMDVDLQDVIVSREVEKSFAAIISRTIAIPLLLLISANVFRSSAKWLYKWGTAVIVLLALYSFHWLLTWMNVITFRHWNLLNSLVMYSLFVVLVPLIEWWFVNLDRREADSR